MPILTIWQYFSVQQQQQQQHQQQALEGQPQWQERKLRDERGQRRQRVAFPLLRWRFFFSSLTFCCFLLLATTTTTTVAAQDSSLASTAAAASSIRQFPTFPCFQASIEPGCVDNDGGFSCQIAVCEIEHVCCTMAWDRPCVTLAQTHCYQDVLPEHQQEEQQMPTLNENEQEEGLLVSIQECMDVQCSLYPDCCQITECTQVLERHCQSIAGAPPEDEQGEDLLGNFTANNNKNDAFQDGDGDGDDAEQDAQQPPQDENETPILPVVFPSPSPGADSTTATSPPTTSALSPSSSTENSCFQASKTPGCSDPICQSILCNIDDYCCERSWDFACISQAMDRLDVCTEDWPPPNNNCFQVEPFGRPKCTEDVCLDLVCSQRPSCCDESYDAECIDTAKQVCELPEPTNHCYETSSLPGCTDSECLQTAVCLEQPECCSNAYSQECVEIAKDNYIDSCPAPPATNDCLDISPVGGCIDSRCARAVCDISSDCCNSGKRVGRWENACVRIAEELCQPEVYDRPSGPCPPGFTCSDTQMANCTEIRLTARDVFEIGDIYAGVYCGDVAEDGYNMKNCEIGMYCPTPEERYPCPEGFFCPHKTASPDIVCNRCKEGSTKLERDLFGYAGLVAIAVLTVSYLLVKLVNRYNQDFVKRLLDFERRVFLNRLQEFEHRINEFRSSKSISILNLGQKKYSQQELKKIRHKIELINRRLASLEESRSNTSRGSGGTDTTTANNISNDNSADANEGYNRIFHGSSTQRFFRSLHASFNSGMDNPNNDGTTTNNTNPTGNSTGIVPFGIGGGGVSSSRSVLRFDARRVFDALDQNSTGEVSFQELNIILGLNDLELHEFVRRMNELAGYKRDRKSVTRPVFAKYFLQVLKETSNLTVSFEEAEVLFDEMADPGTGNNGKVYEIHMSAFYNSSMSGFLSDLQICDLIRRFKKMNAELGNNSRRPSIFFSGSSSGLFRLPTGGRNSGSRMGSTRRRSSFRSQGSGGQTKDTRMVISRDDFVENYPQLLLEVTMDTDSVMAELDVDGYDMEWQYPGVDICFQDLSLNIQIGEKTIRVVDEVTGRIRAKTMTALMGGSGAGKTSLLNALCGRAFYGDVTGSIYLNGHKAISIEHYKDCVGFVPQDDIVYPELTVRENLVYAGRFRLPHGTLDEEIEDLADTTMANLGLSRVADSPVGDVRRRGVSGGERKRVNIGLELMANPSILFLDEPTSGLDASSALLVMKSLKHLVEKDGVTVVSVIHQPRKFIYDLFDSLILLGVGGKTVYHGPRDTAVPYFNRLHYCLPVGESVADWLIDISSGRLEPDCQIAKCRKSEYRTWRKSLVTNNPGKTSATENGEATAQESHPHVAKAEKHPANREDLSTKSMEASSSASVEDQSSPANADNPQTDDDLGDDTIKKTEEITKADDDDQTEKRIDQTVVETEECNSEESPKDALKNIASDETTAADDYSDNPEWKVTSITRGNMGEDILHMAATRGSSELKTRSNDDLELCEIGKSFQTPEGADAATLKRISSSGSLEIDSIMAESPERNIPSQASVGGMSLSAAGRCVTDKDCVGARGVTTGKVVQAAEEAKNRRIWLYSEWNKYCEDMDEDQKKKYEPPAPYPLPVGITKPSFFYQLKFQTDRIFIVAWRNRFSKFIDSVIIIGSLIVITALDGVAVVTEDIEPDVTFEVMVRPNLDDSQELFTGLFRFALTRQIQYALKAGIVICALVGLTATKVLTEKRLVFFREAASGYNLNAYYVAVNIMATTEHTIQVLIAAYFAIWIRNPLASGGSFVIHFLLLGWVVVSWSLFIPMVTPPETVMIAGAFFFVFCALMFSGAFPPILYHQIYDDDGLFQEIFAGWIAATRFFFEAITVGEYRCLPEQTGYTIAEEAINRSWNSSALVALGYAGHDPYATRRSCMGWYWSVIPSLLVGVTVRYAAWLCMHGFHRGEQTKKPLWGIMKSDARVFRDVLLYIVVLVGLIVLTTWTFVRDVPYEEPDREINILDYLL